MWESLLIFKDFSWAGRDEEFSLYLPLLGGGAYLNAPGGGRLLPREGVLPR